MNNINMLMKYFKRQSIMNLGGIEIRRCLGNIYQNQKKIDRLFLQVCKLRDLGEITIDKIYNLGGSCSTKK